MDLTKNRSAIICVKSVEYSENLTGKKDEELIELLLNNNYIFYADTYINSIFLDNTLLDKQQLD